MKPMKWTKRGLVVKPDPRVWWWKSHCMIPTPQQLEGSLYRIYFSGRDDKNRSHIGYCVIDLREPEKILEISSEPVLAPGRLGSFDDNGVTPSCAIVDGNRVMLYYIGWNPGSTTRMHIFGGLAISEDGGKTFQRYSEAPIIERCRVNPFINTAPFVIKAQADEWRMYYVSGVEWVHRDLPRYNIQMAMSRDGLEWKREGHVAIDFVNGENALARPYVLHEDGTYKMWFASKGTQCENYRLRYAESVDGIRWERKDELVGLTVSSSGPDDQMMEYAAIVPWNGRKYMFYNGNNYGFDGICLAIED